MTRADRANRSFYHREDARIILRWKRDDVGEIEIPGDQGPGGSAGPSGIVLPPVRHPGVRVQEAGHGSWRMASYQLIVHVGQAF